MPPVVALHMTAALLAVPLGGWLILRAKGTAPHRIAGRAYVALMLVAGSETVRLIHDKQGRKEAIAFASHIVRLASQHLARPHQNSGKKQTVELEIDV